MFYRNNLNIILLFILLSVFVVKSNSQIVVENGKIDLSEFDFDKKNVSLDGKWEFYGQKLYSPEDFSSSAQYIPSFVEVPKLWNSIEKNNSNPEIKNNDYGTYRIIVRTGKINHLYALNINRIQSAYKLWIDGEVYATEGKVGKNFDEMSPKWSSVDIIFKTNNVETEIIIQVSNFYHKKGGIEHSISFGLPENILNESWSILGLDIFLIGVLVIMFIYHLLMYLLLKKDRSNLYFALFLLFSASFSLTTGEIFMMKIFPDFFWELLIKMNYISNYLRGVFFILFISFLFKKELSKKIVKYIVIVGVGMSFLVLITPARVYTHTLLVFIAFIAFALIYLVLGMVKASFRRKIGAIHSLIGTFIVLAATTNDVLKEFQVIKTISLATFGIFIFVFFQSYMVSLRASASYHNTEKLTKRLQVIGKIKDGFLSAKSSDLRKPVKIISEATGADRILVFIPRERVWYILNEYVESTEESKIINIKAFEGLGDSMFFNEIVKNVIETGFYSNAKLTGSNSYNTPEYFLKNSIQAIFCTPFKKDDDVVAILYIENKIGNTDFNEKNLQLLDIIRSQISVFVDNYILYNELNKTNKDLENRVEERTIEINQQSDELLAQRDEIESHNNVLNKAYNEIDTQSKQIVEGINYARRIQRSLLPDINFIKKIFPKSFVIYRAKDVLSGDFYWIDQIIDKDTEKGLFAVADCTGHGIPGALMTIVGNNLLNSAVNEKKIYEPSMILDYMQSNIRTLMYQDKRNKGLKDGMDVSLFSYDKKNMKIEFSGARSNIYLIKENELIEFRGNKMSIGGVTQYRNTGKLFENISIDVNEGDTVYIFTDGFPNQFGGFWNRKFRRKSFKKMLLAAHKKELYIQRKILSGNLDNWQGENKQTDDILVVGIKI